MSKSRRPSSDPAPLRTPRPVQDPPTLDGYEYLELFLGSGGFSDVFKYLQLHPRREVAVKVLPDTLGEQARRQFEAEVELMARLGTHPFIVSVFAAGLSPDGRSFLVMECCHKGHLGDRLRQQPLPVGRALAIGVQIASAVETLHRSGVLHCDVKPANILFTAYGRPVLADFGAAAIRAVPGTSALSLGWAPPEQIEGKPMGPSGDVYALAATLWAMLVGHAPFARSGEYGGLDLADRVLGMAPTPTGRPDVPASLEAVLRKAMARQPENRHSSALEFARALQSVQTELGQLPTTLEVYSASEFTDTPSQVDGDTARTVVRPSQLDPHPTSMSPKGTDDMTEQPGSRRLCEICGVPLSSNLRCPLCGSEATGLWRPTPPTVGPAGSVGDAAQVAFDVLTSIGGVAGGLAALRSSFLWLRRRLRRRRAGLTMEEAITASVEAIERRFGHTVTSEPREVNVRDSHFTFIWLEGGRKYSADGRLDDPRRVVRLSSSQTPLPPPHKPGTR